MLQVDEPNVLEEEETNMEIKCIDTKEKQDKNMDLPIDIVRKLLLRGNKSKAITLSLSNP